MLSTIHFIIWCLIYLKESFTTVENRIGYFSTLILFNFIITVIICVGIGIKEMESKK
jgi:hypothetical protein